MVPSKNNPRCDTNYNIDTSNCKTCPGVTINSYSAQKLNNWVISDEVNDYPVKVCAKRLKDYNFFSTKEKCDLGEKSCILGKNIFCILREDPCPITSVIVSENNPDTTIYND